MSQPCVVLATASYDHTIRFWEAESGRCYRTIQYPDSHVNRLEITPDKRHLAAACNPHIRLFDVNSNSPQPVMTYDSHTNNVMAVGFQCDGKWMYSGSEDGTVKIWDLRAPGCQREYESVAAVNTVVLHPNQTELISGDQNGNIRVWDLRANSCSCELVPEVDTPVRSLTVMWDGTMVVAANNRGTCYVWRLLRGKQTMTEFEPLHKLQAHNGHILKCLLSPANKYLATASSDKTVKIWNVDGFKLEKVLTGHQRWVWDCVFSVDGEFLVTASSDMTARLWSMPAGKEVKVYQGHHKATLQAHNGHILKCLLSPANKYLATASSDKTVKIWNVDGFKLEKVLTGHQRWVWDCVFSVDGEFLVTASSDMTARLWSMPAGKEVKVYQGHHKATVCCALHD